MDKSVSDAEVDLAQDMKLPYCPSSMLGTPQPSRAAP